VETTTSDEALTIGVALTVPEPWGSRIQERRAEYGDHLAWTIPTHVTLLPPTQVSNDNARLVDSHLRDVASGQSTFRVRLCGTDTFRPVTQTSFVVVDQGASECKALEQAVRSGPLQRRLPFPYHPHVTIAHHLPDEALDRAFGELADFESLFGAEEFHLYVHDEEKGWQPSLEFPLVPVEA